MTHDDSEFDHGITIPRRAFLTSAAGAAGALMTAARQVDASDSKPLRLGLIGAGLRGSALAESIVGHAAKGEPVELAAVCDLYKPRLERAAARFNAKPYSTSSEMVRDSGIDAIIIATPDRHHVGNILEAIRAGKDVYCEKPLSHWSQFDKLRALMHESRSHKRIVQLGTQFAADTVWEKSAELVRSGAIGKPVHAQTCYFRRGDQGERGMVIDNPNATPGPALDWEAFEADAPRREFTVSRLFQWRLYMDYSGGPVTDVYPHMLTPLFRVLQPGFPKKVVALGGRYFFNHGREVPDTFDLIIQYPQDLTVVCLGTFVNDTHIETVVRGSEGTLVKKPAAIVCEPQPKVDKPRHEIPCDFPSLSGEGHGGSTGVHLRNFFNCVRTRQEPRANLELAYMVQVPLIMAMQSHLNGIVAYFDPEKEQIRLGRT